MPEARAEVAVLAFHKVGSPPPGGWETWNYVSEEQFTEFLEILREDGYEVLDLARFLALQREPNPAPKKRALLTFDDGYRSMLTVAEPILARFGYPSVLFVPTDYVAGVNTWDLGNEPEEPICSFEDLAELQRRGVAVQSHSCAHRTFSELDAAELAQEVSASKRLLDAHLPHPVETFAYPYGDGGADADAVDAVLEAAGYRAAFLYKGGVTPVPTPSPFRITRIPVGPDTNLRKWLGGAA